MIPGIKSGVEVFMNNDELMVMHNCQIKKFDEISVDLRKYFESFIDAKALKGLELLKIDEKGFLKKFLECRYGRLDSLADFESDCTISEFVDCSMKSECPAAGLLCVKKIDDLTSKERDVVMLIGQDVPDKQIADRLNISNTTVATHRRNIEKKLNVPSKVGVARYAFDHNLLPV
jgi:DNA-binding CsgD family transcriptional regulator